MHEGAPIGSAPRAKTLKRRAGPICLHGISCGCEHGWLATTVIVMHAARSLGGPDSFCGATDAVGRWTASVQ
eukprot:354442-Chlamydomonas_euryale.AAC.5